MAEEVEASDCAACRRLQSRLERALRQLERQVQAREELRGENELLKRHLHEFKRRRCEEVATQTEEAPPGDPELEAAVAGGECSVAELLRDTANACLNQNGYVYDEKSGLYYDYGSGYYYDPHTKLFYEPRSGTYYSYDEEAREYRLHSRENADHLRRHCEQLFVQSGSQHAPPKKRARRKVSEKKEAAADSVPFIGPIFNGAKEAEEEEGEEEEESCEEEDVEEGEITSESEQEDELEVPEEEEEEVEEEEEEKEEAYPPCVRLTVLSSPSLDVGSLFIVTCSGGTVGRTSTRHRHAVTVDDPTAREKHAVISYNAECFSYSIRDTKKNGDTCVNGERAAKGDSLALKHGDRLCVAETEMLVHIHEGNETCDACEPGVAMANAKTADDAAVPQLPLEERRREESKRLRSKFGLRGAAFESVRVRGRDRAAERRRKVGSDLPASAVKEEVASTHRQIPESNRGAQMLAKMGWKPGQALGKSGTGGIVEPVTAELRLDPHAGLGAAGPALSLDAASSPATLSRARHLQKMRERLAHLPPEAAAAGEQ